MKWKEWVKWSIGEIEKQVNLNKKESRIMDARIQALEDRLIAEHDAINAKLVALKEQIAALQVGIPITQEDIDALVAIIDDTTQDVATA